MEVAEGLRCLEMDSLAVRQAGMPLTLPIQGHRLVLHPLRKYREILEAQQPHPARLFETPREEGVLGVSVEPEYYLQSNRSQEQSAGRDGIPCYHHPRTEPLDRSPDTATSQVVAEPEDPSVRTYLHPSVLEELEESVVVGPVEILQRHHQALQPGPQEPLTRAAEAVALEAPAVREDRES